MSFGLIGERVSHSYSKLIHEQLAGYPYALHSLSPHEVEDFVTKGDWQGLNVTIPYKKTVIPFCSRLSDRARAIGSVNTLLKDAGGAIVGDNTDYDGFVTLLAHAGAQVRDKKVLILGSGGASLTAQAVCRDRGAREVLVVSRSGSVTYEDLGAHRDAQVIVNTTPVGMFPNNAQSPVSLAAFSKLEGVVDAVYHPLRTRLVQEALERGIPASGGLPMLVSQAVSACRLFTGRALPETALADTLGWLTAERENIVLIGMPGSGKTSVGKALAELLNRPLEDTDAWAEKEAGMPIPEIFARHGEAVFRALEARAVQACGEKTGQIIATGGGAVLSFENIRNLRQNGRLYWLDRDPVLLPAEGRPLSAAPGAIMKLFEARAPLYRRYADAVIDANQAIGDAAQAIREEFYEACGYKRP